MEFQNRYRKLNAHQKEAVDCIDGPVMVIAGPGTGKTELLSMRTATILQKTDTLPENILCLTFTESGANAMRERLSHIIGPDAYKVAIHTFHSFGTEIINQNSEFFYRGAAFKPADELSQYEIIRTIFDGLEYDNPLAAKMGDEYTHLGDTLSVISELKKSGLTSDELLQILDTNDAVIEKIEPKLREIFAGRIAKSIFMPLQNLAAYIGEKDEPMPLPGIISLAKICSDSLQTAIDMAEEENSTKPITAWRNHWLKKDQAGNFVLKARERQIKLRAVSYIYYQYMARMEQEQLFDFDDMIMQVVHAMEVAPDLRFNLQEKYLYIMVDEFQDTNLAQMRILYNLTNNEVHAGRPNILVVGDDDQAIYSFQGADVGNINAFLRSFNEAKLITLTDNYRSADVILAKAREVISLGQDRLENIIAALNKTLTPHYENQLAQVQLIEHASKRDERRWLASEVKRAIDQGARPEQIAIIARRHHELVSLLPYFAEVGVPVNYEHRDNVLDQEPIKLIVHIAQLVACLFQGDHDEADVLLPELLAHPAFGFTPSDVWKLSLTAYKNHQGWLEVMRTTPEFMPLAEWLIELSQQQAHTPLETMLDTILGLSATHQEQDSPHTDDQPKAAQQPAFTSPLFTYFFSAEKLQQTPDAYLSYLEGLRTIRTKLRDYQPNDTPSLLSFLDFIRLHHQLGSVITSIRPRSEKLDDAINLMTAHKSKGLEFDTVFIIGAVDSAWGERVRTRSRLINYPENLPFAPSGDTFDERLRLFFVAMTRARRSLTISYSTSDDSGKNLLRASFLVGESWQPKILDEAASLEELTHAAEISWHQPLVRPITSTMKQLLRPTLETYKLSSTHLNNFLDVTRGGPQSFLMSNLLRFPQAMSPQAAFGSAIHAALQQAHAHLCATGSLRPIEDTLHDLEENLRAYRLTDKEFEELSQKGSRALGNFLNAHQASFTPTQKTELNFSSQSVQIDGVRLTGSLDLVDIDTKAKTLIVTDYKTGKAPTGWQGKTDYEKIKLHKYRQQLMFYQLLAAHSRDYGNYTFVKGILQFVEPTSTGDFIALEADISADELAEFTVLLQAVWRHIVTLDLPDISSYETSYKGIVAFEQALIDEKL